MYKQLEQLKKEHPTKVGNSAGMPPCNLSTCGSNGGGTIPGGGSNLGGGDNSDGNTRTSSHSPVGNVGALKTSPAASPNNLSRNTKSPLIISHNTQKNNSISVNNNHHHPLNNSNSTRASPSIIAAAVGRIARLNHHHFVEDMISSGDDMNDPEEQSHHHHGGRRRASVSPLMTESARIARASAERELSTGSRSPGVGPGQNCCWEVLALNISPDLGERIMLSGERALIEEAFPETGHAVMDARSTVAWHHDARHVIRFPLNGYCKLNSVQAITRLLNVGYRVVASHGGGMDSQQFSEYLFIRKAIPL